MHQSLLAYMVVFSQWRVSNPALRSQALNLWINKSLIRFVLQQLNSNFYHLMNFRNRRKFERNKFFYVKKLKSYCLKKKEKKKSGYNLLVGDVGL